MNFHFAAERGTGNGTGVDRNGDAERGKNGGGRGSDIKRANKMFKVVIKL